MACRLINTYNNCCKKCEVFEKCRISGAISEELEKRLIMKAKKAKKNASGWNVNEKPVKIYLPDLECKKAEKLNSDVRWGFIFRKKKTIRGKK